MQNNPILDANNQPIDLSNLFGRFLTNTLSGLPLGTVGESTQGEIGLKVIQISGVGGTNGASFVVPAYDQMVFTYYGSTNNVHTQVFKKATVTVSTLTFSYVGGGAANDDLISNIQQS